MSVPPRSEIKHAVTTMDAPIGPQGADLISELRRLQKVLEQGRSLQSRRYPQAPGAQAAAGRRTVAQSVQYVRQGENVLFHQWPVQKTDRMTPHAAETDGRHRGRPIRNHSLKSSAARLLKKSGLPSPARLRSDLRLSFKAGAERVRASPALARLASGCAFVIGRASGATVEGKSEVGLSARLIHAFEGELRTGLRVLIFGIGILAGWAILVPLSSAVVVPGNLVTESEVKKIQHPAGGVVAEIDVRNGMHVRAGDLLMHLDETQLKANAQVLSRQLDQTRVRLARLRAERDGMNNPAMPQEISARSRDEDFDRLWASEISLFNSRAAARASAKDLLQNNIAQLREQISGLEAQVQSKSAQRDLISGELQGVDSLYQKGLVPLARKTALEREAARLNGDRGQALAAIAEAKSRISEAELKAVRLDEDFRTEVMKDLRETQDKEAELIEKTTAARDLLRRVDLRAPTDGIIHQLSVHTIGGVIAPGEVVMEIVPESDALQIAAKLPPRDIDHVHPGQRAYVRFSAFNQRFTPQLDGVVSYVSADLSHDGQPNSNAGYYSVRVTLPPAERRRLENLKLVSGMPAEVFLQTGRRTMMSYLLKPISDQLLRTFN